MLLGSAQVKRAALLAAVTVIACVTVAPAVAQQGSSQGPRSSAKPVQTARAGEGTIFWSLDKGGSLLLSDRPAAGGAQSGSRTYAVSKDQQTLARAQSEREYWRHQAEGFSARQRDREREIEETRRLRLLQTRENERSNYYPIYPRAIGWYPNMGAPLVGGFNVAPSYTSSPGAAAQSGPANFQSSGFANPLRR